MLGPEGSQGREHLFQRHWGALPSQYVNAFTKSHQTLLFVYGAFSPGLSPSWKLVGRAEISSPLITRSFW